MDKIMIDLQDIRKTYRIGSQDFAALAGITLQIAEGEFAALMGPSGSGKSTLMNILGCLDRPTSGSYKLDGREVANLSDNELALTRNKSIGFVFQNFNLLGRISALDNVALPLVYAGIGKEERTERAMEKLRAVGLGTWSHHKPNELSGGQRQRVAIARALINNPHIIMADEPTGNLDTKSTHEIMDIFESLHQEKKTIILVTHEPEIAARASRQLLLSDGVITKDAGKGVVMDVV
ncbi:ABC transporter ATP-binding protein [Anaeroglobus geminatus]|jgi:ABC-type antimicrobial peptide transport system, ATPase component|uniref:ABC transporter, ATP-binding protein n=1 Tax=Anaeroglobus geminatus F0357 TaxID=861450 RepID=G9YJD8_9FIRM|nr:ABC transporter ATP-binding protein [Anaeroglobus geminatus]EHM38655.1 ABC transporter, ATP-binding protein [Anaeroglobus geminatus F0357]